VGIPKGLCVTHPSRVKHTFRGARAASATSRSGACRAAAAGFCARASGASLGARACRLSPAPPTFSGRVARREEPRRRRDDRRDELHQPGPGAPRSDPLV